MVLLLATKTVVMEAASEAPQLPPDGGGPNSRSNTIIAPLADLLAQQIDLGAQAALLAQTLV